METIRNPKLSRFEALLGVAVIGIAVLCLPWLDTALDSAKDTSSRNEAGRIAQAVLDYHTQMGSWPSRTGQPIPLGVLADSPPATATVGSMIPGGTRPWLDEVPVDAWGRPFQAWVFDERTPAVTIDDDMAIDDTTPPRPAPFPDTPPAGVTIIVVSAGPDGIIDTHPERLSHAAVAAFAGDDIGFILQGARPDPLSR